MSGVRHGGLKSVVSYVDIFACLDFQDDDSSAVAENCHSEEPAEAFKRLRNVQGVPLQDLRQRRPAVPIDRLTARRRNDQTPIKCVARVNDGYQRISAEITRRGLLRLPTSSP